MSGPLVTVLIPTYERVGWLETAVESVLAQDYEHLEAIVLDDGSTDATPALLERIAARAAPGRLRVERHENVGQAATINRGLELARGDLLGYLSSDDYLYPGAISALVAAAEAHPEADVLYPGFHVIDDAERVRDTIEPMQHTFAEALRWAVCIPGVGALVRRRLYERIGGWDPTYRFSPDFEWWLRAGDARFVRVPGILGAWRTHDGSISSSLPTEAAYERLRLLDELFARPDLSDEVLAIRVEAYATALIQCGVMLDGNGLGQATSRFVIHDALGPVMSRRGADDLLAAYQAKVDEVVHLTRQVRAAEASIEEAQGRSLALDGALREQEEQLAQLRAAVAASEAARAEADSARAAAERALAVAAAARPLWLRAGRRLTPPALRHRVGTVVHLVRSGR